MELSVDVGGTFTDFVYRDDHGEVHSFKLPSTPKDPSVSIASGLKELPNKPSVFIHGTTVATNTVLTRTGSRTALVTTAGFADILHIGRQVRPSLYDLTITKKPQLVPRSLCFEVHGRMDHNGKVLEPIGKDDLKELASRLTVAKVDAVAVCLLFSYLNPEHERAVGKYLRGQLDVPVALSSEILPEFREFERASTTVMNAYLLRSVGDYLENLGKTMSQTGLSDFFVMQSSGGVALSKYIRNIPVRTLLSGPAAGVAAAASLGEQIGEKNLITFDMGGTSADVASIIDGNISWTSEGEIDSLPLKLPMVEIVTIGAGGGSIANIDAGGALTVGPESAGANPGPACYDKGGKQLTVTDADLMLGVIDPEFFLGGKFILNEKRAYTAGKKLSGKLGAKLDDIAEGVRRVADANMLRAISKVTVEKGQEPRNFALVAFGGAGPIHAPALARELNIPKVIVPASPGTFSAHGLLLSDIKLDYSQTFLSEVNKSNVEKKIRSIIKTLMGLARRSLDVQNIPFSKALLWRSLDLRYRGQSHEVNIPMVSTLSEAVSDFHRLHHSRFGYSSSGADVELVNVRLSVTAKRDSRSIHEKKVIRKKRGSHKKNVIPLKTKKVLSDGKWFDTPFFNRNHLGSGWKIRGPAVIVDGGSTALVLPGMTAEIDVYGNIVMMIK